VFRLSLPNDVLRKAAAVNPANVIALVFRSEPAEVDTRAA
jgi:hypothetical protein